MSPLTACWTPSAARTVAVVPPRPLRGVRVAQRPLSWPAKAPVEALDYTLDLSAWMADGRDLISSVSAAITPAGAATDLGIAWLAIEDQAVVLTAAGGSAGMPYQVAVTVTTAAGRVGFWLVGLPVDRHTPSAAPAAPSYPPAAALLPGGVIIQDPTGAQPLILA